MMYDTDTMTATELLHAAAAIEALIGARAPQLEVATITDDDGETYAALRCAECGIEAHDGNLYAVDTAERWSPATSDLDAEAVAMSGDDGGADWGSTLYYLHEVGIPHPVSLPDGWSERWI